MNKLNSLPPEKLNKIARDILDGRTVTSAQVPHDLWNMVFMPLVFMKKEDISEDIYCIYGDPESCTSGRCINGYPIFFGCGFLNKEDTIKVMNLVKKMESALKSVEIKPAMEDDKIQTKLEL